jgi:hypothetical protein
MYVLQLCRFLGTVIEELGRQARAKGLPMPFLEAFFHIFRLTDREFRTRKLWSIQ